MEGAVERGRGVRARLTTTEVKDKRRQRHTLSEQESCSERVRSRRARSFRRALAWACARVSHRMWPGDGPSLPPSLPSRPVGSGWEQVSKRTTREHYPATHDRARCPKTDRSSTPRATDRLSHASLGLSGSRSDPTPRPHVPPPVDRETSIDSHATEVDQSLGSTSGGKVGRVPVGRDSIDIVCDPERGGL